MSRKPSKEPDPLDESVTTTAIPIDPHDIIMAQPLERELRASHHPCVKHAILPYRMVISVHLN
jgi:hypothetical protein